MATLAELRTFRPLRYRVTVDDEVIDTEAMLVAVGAVPTYGGGLRGLRVRRRRAAGTAAGRRPGGSGGADGLRLIRAWTA